MRGRCIVAISALCAVLVACSSGPGRGAAPQSAPASTTADSLIPTVPADGDVEGAVQVALTFVASTDDLMGHSAIGRREIIRRLVASESVTAQLDAFELAAADLAATLDVPVERLLWVEAPISAAVIDVTATAATIDVWTVSVLGAPDAGSPQQAWRTVHLSLVDTPDGWLVEDATADAGPTPAANELALQSGFEEFERVADWTPVVQGVGL